MDSFSAQIKTRLIASGVHLLGSVTVISFYLGLVLFIWYPHPYQIVHSTSDVIWILVAVDVVLGPLFTLLIFDVRKTRRELMRDMAIILFIQISALLWGVSVTFTMRPVFVVFQEETVYTIVEQDIDTTHLPERVSLPALWERPKLIYIEPLDVKEKVQLVTDVLTGKAPDIIFQTQRYRPFSADFREDALKHAIPYQKLTDRADKELAMRKFLDEHHGTMEDYAFFPVESAGFAATIVFKRSDFSVVGLIDLKI